MLKLDKNKIISAVYEAILPPKNFEEMVGKLDEAIFGASPLVKQGNFISFPIASETQNSEVALDPELLTHFQLAHEIRTKIGRPRTEKGHLSSLLEATPNPAWVFDQTEKIIAQNQHATEKSTSHPTLLSDFCTDPELLTEVRTFTVSGQEQKLLIVPGYVNEEQDTAACVFVRKIENHDGIEIIDTPTSLFLFTIVDFGFTPSTTELFQQTYNLTPAEMSIATLLAGGKKPPEIASERNVSLQTIRTQVKTIKTKTNTRDVAALVRLLCGFSAGLFVPSQLATNDETATQENTPQKSLGQITLRDGRKLSYLEQGNANGTPVLMIHNMPYGVTLPENALHAASRLNLRIIAPYRPGYGDSDPNKNAQHDKRLDETATDMYELLDHLNVTKAAVVGQTVGSIYALRFARMYPNRVSKLLAISRAPIWRDEWLVSMPKHQKMVVRLARQLPQLLPFIIRATIAFIDEGNVEKLIPITVKNSPQDFKAIGDPEILHLMATGCVEGLKQGGDAFCQDCFLTIQDFTDEAKTLSHKFHVLHGRDDTIVDIAQSKAFVDAVPGTTLEIVDGAGQLLFYSHWERVLNAIKSRVNR